jgi:hypothetical protein
MAMTETEVVGQIREEFLARSLQRRGVRSQAKATNR